MPASTAQITPEALLLLPRPALGKHYELSDGELIVVGSAGALHELIKTRIFEILSEYRLKTNAGRAFAETQFTLRADRARIPDVAWVSESKLGLIPRANRAIPIAPDLAIEIISDSEVPQETEQRLRDYLEADTEVWQVFPALSSVTVWRRNEGVRLAKEQVLTSECLPGFSIAVWECFRGYELSEVLVGAR
ncbi:MAG TPA: Uma2 family endonuclease [Bryobacteraceae bacterium]|jgi:Uma2 family endonuclease|nr:Uma2 family endonuclease [Bryobacteraceae bacterium]